MAHRDIVVVGASAGGVEALQRLIGGLPSDFAASVFISVHFPERGTSVLPRILARASELTVVGAVDGDAIVPGRVYVAPPDHHMLLDHGAVCVVRGPRENGNRPAIDPMFRSAAVAFGPRVIGVVLTGNLDDGTSGLKAIKRAGGVAVVQDPEDALFSSMPRSAIEHVEVDRVLPLRTMAAAIVELTSESVLDVEHPPVARDDVETRFAAASLDAMGDPEHHPGRLSAYGCPDCGGVLWEIDDGEFSRYRCRVGHAWTSSALLERQADVIDDALWTALRALEESAAISRQIAARYRERGSPSFAARFESRAQSAETRAAVIRDSLVQRRAPRTSAVEEEEGDRETEEREGQNRDATQRSAPRRS